MATFSHQQLVTFAERVLTHLGVNAADARHTATLLVRADLRGYPTHGIVILPEYVERADAGIIHLDATPSIVSDGKATAQIDGGLYLGQVVASQAMALAIDKARAHGVGIVGVRNSAHFGRLAEYVEQAAEAGMCAVAFATVGGSSLATLGAAEPTGNSNPIAFGAPGRDGDHVVFDFTTASMSMREIARRGARGEAIPPDILLDRAGNPTADYATYSGPPRGMVVPFGGHKGSGLHLIAEVFAAILTGHGTGLSWAARGGPAVNGGLFLAIDIAEFMPVDQFHEEIAQLAAFLRSRKPLKGQGPVRLPGEGARAREAQRRAEGIPLDDAVVASLDRTAQALGLPPLA